MSNGKNEVRLAEMSIAAIKVDFAMQSRVEMNLDHVRRITEAIVDGATFKNAPVDVFEIKPGVYILAEGFHRIAGHKKAGKTAIWANVHQGTKSDAVAFAASANLRYDALTVTKEDKKKAARMLLEDSVQFSRADKVLGEICGIASATFGKIRKTYCVETGRPIPHMVKTSSGRLVSYDKTDVTRGVPQIREVKEPKSKSGVAYRACVRGKQVYLGPDLDKAKSRLENLTESLEDRRAKLHPNQELTNWLLNRRVLARNKMGSLSVGMFPKAILPGALARVDSIASPRSAAQAVGDLFFWRAEIGDPSLRLILICYPDGADMQALIEPARNFGVEILTPEQVVEQFAGKKFPDESESA